MSYRVKITTPDATEIEALPKNDIELTQRLIDDDNGAFFYRTFCSELKYRGQNFSILNTLENSLDRCEECSLVIERNNGTSWVVVFNGFFTMADCKFNIDQCEVSFTPKPDDEYRCLTRNYDVRHNMLDIATSVTVNEPVNRPSVFADPFAAPLRGSSYEFYVTDGTAGQEPYNVGEIGYNSNNQVSFSIGGNAYQVFWRVVFVLECSGGSCSADVAILEGGINYEAELVTNDCADSGLCTYAITEASNTPPTWDSFTSGDFVEEASATSSGNNILVASELYAGAWLFVNPVLSNGGEYSNGRDLSDVLDFLLAESCPTITDVRSNFFRINPTGASSVLDQIDQFEKVALYQITDITNFNATDDATRAMISLKDILEELSVFKIRWKVDGTTLVIEHLADLEPTGTSDHSSVTGFRQYEYDSSVVPKREIYSSPFQRTPDFVGDDVVYTGGCVGDDNKNISLRLFNVDLLYCQSSPDEVSTDGFFLMNYVEVDSVNYVKLAIGGITGNSIMNGNFAFANTIPQLNAYRMFDSAVEVNGESFTPESVVRLRKSNITISNCNLTFDAENLIITQLGTGIVTEAKTSLQTSKCVVDYRF